MTCAFEAEDLSEMHPRSPSVRLLALRPPDVCLAGWPAGMQALRRARASPLRRLVYKTVLEVLPFFSLSFYLSISREFSDEDRGGAMKDRFGAKKFAHYVVRPAVCVCEDRAK